MSRRNRQAEHLFAGLPPRYDLMAEILSFGQNGRWRRFMVSRVPVGNSPSVLDVATGTGRVALDLIGRGARVTAVDQSPEMLAAAGEAVSRLHLEDRARLVLGRGERLPFPDSCFDSVTFTYLLRYVDDPAAALAELTRVLRPGGVLANLEFHLPSNPLAQGAWWVYTRYGLPAAGALVSRAWYHVGRFLGPSISSFYQRHPLDEQLEMWRGAGLSDVRHRTMSLGGGIVIWAVKAGV